MVLHPVGKLLGSRNQDVKYIIPCPIIPNDILVHFVSHYFRDH